MAHKIFYMNATSTSETWFTNEANACNDSTANYMVYVTRFTGAGLFYYSGNNAVATNYGTISSVHLLPYTYSNSPAPYGVSIRSIFNGTGGTIHYLAQSGGEANFNITSDSNAPATWSWSNVTTLTGSLTFSIGGATDTNYLYRTRIYVYYTPVASTLAWSSPAAASTHYRAGTGIAIAGTAANINGVAKVQYNVNGGSWVDCTGTTSWSAIVPQSSLSYGAFTINTRVQDSSTDSVWTTTTARAFAQSSLPSQII